MADTVVKLDVPERIQIEFQLGDRLIDGVIVRPLMFERFVDAVQDTGNMKGTATFEAKLRRTRMHRQTTFYIGNAVTQISNEELTRMPIRVAQTILKKMGDSEQPSGKIVKKGDGIDTSVVYELATPIPVAGPNKQPISELEFLASTYGDIEDVLAAPSGLLQTLMMIKTIGKPLGTSLSALPSWAVSQITMSDGYGIMLHVLPLFIGSPEDL